MPRSLQLPELHAPWIGNVVSAEGIWDTHNPFARHRLQCQRPFADWMHSKHSHITRSAFTLPFPFLCLTPHTVQWLLRLALHSWFVWTQRSSVSLWIHEIGCVVWWNKMMTKKTTATNRDMLRHMYLDLQTYVSKFSGNPLADYKQNGFEVSDLNGCIRGTRMRGSYNLRWGYFIYAGLKGIVVRLLFEQVYGLFWHLVVVRRSCEHG